MPSPHVLFAQFHPHDWALPQIRPTAQIDNDRALPQIRPTAQIDNDRAFLANITQQYLPMNCLQIAGC